MGDYNYGDPFIERHWPWNIQESHYFEGADLVYIDVDVLDAVCGSVDGAGSMMTYAGEQREFKIDLWTSFQCLNSLGAWDTQYSGSITFHAVHWANEALGTDAALWTSVHGMEMTTERVTDDYLSAAKLRTHGGRTVADAYENASDEVLAIRRRFVERCRAHAPCWERNRQYMDRGILPVVDAGSKPVGGLLSELREMILQIPGEDI